MSQTDSQQEPTMEEILASIRRIISEEGDTAEGDGEAGEAAESAEEEAVTLDDGDTAAVEAEEPAAEEGDDVLELTEMVAEDGSVVSLEDEEGTGDEEASGEDIAFEEADEEAAAELEPEPESDMSAETEPEPEPAAAGEPDLDKILDSGLVSDPVADQAAATFAGLSGAVMAARGVPMGDSHKTLEELVKELLRPMLKEWLDQNLAALVQRIVEREVERLAGRSDRDQSEL